MSEPLVVIGNGMAAARFVDELSSRALGRYAVAVVGEEPRLAYNRVLLSSVLAGEVASSDIELKPAHWWRDRGVTLRYGCRARLSDEGLLVSNFLNRHRGLAAGMKRMGRAFDARACALPACSSGNIIA